MVLDLSQAVSGISMGFLLSFLALPPEFAWHVRGKKCLWTALLDEWEKGVG
jgi:hypothetical protein